MKNNPDFFGKSNLKKTIKRGRKILGNIRKGKGSENLIIHEAKEGDELLAHELGHLGNRKDGGLITKLINKKANNPKIRTDLDNDANNIFGTKGNPLKKYLEGKIIVAEERNASNRGLNYMKESGYSPEEIEKAKKRLGEEGALGTYKTVGNARWKASLRNKIAIPSNVGKQIKN